MDKTKLTKALGIGGTVLGVVATLVANYASEQKQKETIEKKIQEALQNQNK